MPKAIPLKEINWYGPHECGRCGGPMIYKAATEQGDIEYLAASRPVYPGDEWKLHECPKRRKKPSKKGGYSMLEFVVIVALGALVIFASHFAPDNSNQNVGSASSNPALPDSAMTPGATNPAITQATIAQTICNPNWSTKSIRPPVSYTTPLKIKQITLYAYKDTSTASYEEDHLISLELGGSPTDPKNLWPEPYQLKYGAHQKDLVENYLHKQVCAGAMSLQAAQDAIRTDWTRVYNKIAPPGTLGSTLGTVDQDDE